MTETDHCAENALAERVNGILKSEYGLGGQFKTKAGGRLAVDQAVHLYNTRRPPTPRWGTARRKRRTAWRHESMQASKVRGSKTGLASRRNCAASRLRSAAKRRNQPPETTQEDTRHTVKFKPGLDRQTGQERLPDVTVSSKGGPLTPALSPSEGERENRRQLSGESGLMGREIPPSAGGSVNWCHRV